MGRKSNGRLFKRGRVYWLEYYINGVRRQVSLKTRDIDEARKEQERIITPLNTADQANKLRAVVHQLRDAEDEHAAARLSASDIPIKDCFERFARMAECGKSTLKQYRQIWGIFCRWLDAEHPYVDSLSKIDRQLALAYAVDLAEGRAPRTFNAHRNALMRVTEKLRLASALEGTNPWKFVETKPLDTKSKKEFSDAQVQAIFDKLADEAYGIPNRLEWQIIYHAGAFSGMRLADCVLLTWDCLDLDRNELSVIPLKTARKGKRAHIPIHPAFGEQLQAASSWRRNSFICPTLAERYQANPTGVQKDAVRVLEDTAANLEETACHFVVRAKVAGRQQLVSQYGFHSLRHSFVSFCANAGVPLAVVQAIVGHGSPAMTRHYTHIDRSSTQRAVNALPIGRRVAVGTSASLEDRVAEAIRLLEMKETSETDAQVLALLRGDAR